jgi:3-keto-L-gulonate-6-phosphate decarboxylase
MCWRGAQSGAETTGGATEWASVLGVTTKQTIAPCAADAASVAIAIAMSLMTIRMMTSTTVWLSRTDQMEIQG